MAKSKADKPKKPASKAAEPGPAPDPVEQAKAQADAEAQAAEEQRLKLIDRDEEDEIEQNLRERATASQPAPSAPGALDTSLCVIEYIGPKRARFPVMFGDSITWFGRDANDGLEPWQGRVERWYASAIMAQEPGWWKMVKNAPPPRRAGSSKKTEYTSTAWMSVRTLEDVEEFAKRIERSTPPTRISYLRKLVTSFRAVQSDETAAAIDNYVSMFPPVVATPEDAPRGGARRVADDQDQLDDEQDAGAIARDDDTDPDEADFQ